MKKSIADIYAQLNSIEKSVKESNDKDIKEDSEIALEDKSADLDDKGTKLDKNDCEYKDEKSKVKKGEEEEAEEEKSKVKKDDDEGDEEGGDDEEESVTSKSIDPNAIIAKSIDVIDLLSKNVFITKSNLTKVEPVKNDVVVKSVIDQYNDNVVCAKIGAALQALDNEFCDIEWSGQDDESKLTSFKDSANELIKILENIENDDDDVVAKSVTPDKLNDKSNKEDKDVKNNDKVKDNKDGDPDVSNESDKGEKTSKSMPEGKADSFKDGEAEPVEKSELSDVSKSQLQEVIIKSIKELKKSQSQSDQQRIIGLQGLSSNVGSGEEKVAKSFVDQYLNM